MGKKFNLEEELRKIEEERADDELKAKISFTREELTLLSYFQNHGRSKIEDILVSAPAASIVESILERLQNKGYLTEQDGYWGLSQKRYDE